MYSKWKIPSLSNDNYFKWKWSFTVLFKLLLCAKQTILGKMKWEIRPLHHSKSVMLCCTMCFLLFLGAVLVLFFISKIERGVIMLYYAMVKEVHFNNDCFCMRKIFCSLNISHESALLAFYYPKEGALKVYCTTLYSGWQRPCAWICQLWWLKCINISWTRCWSKLPELHSKR